MTINRVVFSWNFPVFCPRGGAPLDLHVHSRRICVICSSNNTRSECIVTIYCIILAQSALLYSTVNRKRKPEHVVAFLYSVFCNINFCKGVVLSNVIVVFVLICHCLFPGTATQAITLKYICNRSIANNNVMHLNIGHRSLFSLFSMLQFLHKGLHVLYAIKSWYINTYRYMPRKLS